MSAESEQVLLASALASAAHFERIVSRVTEADFLDPRARSAWVAVKAYREQGRDCDPAVIAATIGSQAAWESDEEAATYLRGLSAFQGTLSLLAEHMRIVRNAAATRKLTAYARAVQRAAENPELDADAKIGEAHALLDRVSGDEADDLIEYGDASGQALRQVMDIYRAGGGLSGLSSGFEAIDAMTSGFQPSDLIILGARPSQGKTALAMNIAHHVARTQPVLMFSLEMDARALARRAHASLGEINMNDLKNGRLDEQMESRLRSAHEQMRRMQLRIDHTGGLSVDQLRTRARVAARRKKPALIIVDYLTQLSGKGENQTLRVGYVSGALKNLAKELEIPILCLAQCNRSLASRPDKRPGMTDLRDSGQIEQDADVIMFNHLDEKYDPDSHYKGFMEVIFAKQRNGETGSVWLKWEGQYQRCSNANDVPRPKEEEEPAPRRMTRSSRGQARAANDYSERRYPA